MVGLVFFQENKLLGERLGHILSWGCQGWFYCIITVGNFQEIWFCDSLPSSKSFSSLLFLGILKLKPHQCIFLVWPISLIGPDGSEDVSPLMCLVLPC